MGSTKYYKRPTRILLIHYRQLRLIAICNLHHHDALLLALAEATAVALDWAEPAKKLSNFSYHTFLHLTAF